MKEPAGNAVLDCFSYTRYARRDTSVLLPGSLAGPAAECRLLRRGDERQRRLTHFLDFTSDVRAAIATNFRF